MAPILTPILGLFGGGAAAGAAAAGGAAAALGPGMWGASLATAVPLAGAFPAAPIAAGAAAGGLSLSTILQGGASVLGLVSSIQAGQAERDQMEMMAQDAEAEQPLETLKGIERRRSLKLSAIDAIGEMDAAYAGSGVDLSFGTAAQARQDALRELDLGLTSDASTTTSRLSLRAANYRSMGKRAMRAGIISGVAGALSSGASIAGRY